MGMITTFIGLPKGRELWAWLALYAYILIAFYFVDVRQPFWTVLVGSIASGVAVATVQTAFMDKFAHHNPWYRPEMSTRKARVALSFFAFAVFAGAIFGVVVGAIAWGVSAL